MSQLNSAGFQDWDNEPQEQNSTAKIWAGRLAGFAITVIFTLSFVFTLVQGFKNAYLYLLCVNLLLSGFITSAIVYWYVKGILAIEKYWFTFAVSMVLLLQNIATDMYIFK